MSEFKIGDIVYCNNDKLSGIKYLIFGIWGNWFNIIDVETKKTYRYQKQNFISEREYIINQRKEKILKLKDGIQSRRHSLLC